MGGRIYDITTRKSRAANRHAKWRLGLCQWRGCRRRVEARSPFCPEHLAIRKAQNGWSEAANRAEPDAGDDQVAGDLHALAEAERRRAVIQTCQIIERHERLAKSMPTD